MSQVQETRPDDGATDKGAQVALNKLSGLQCDSFTLIDANATTTTTTSERQRFESIEIGGANQAHDDKSARWRVKTGDDEYEQNNNTIHPPTSVGLYLTSLRMDNSHQQQQRNRKSALPTDLGANNNRQQAQNGAGDLAATTSETTPTNHQQSIPSYTSIFKQAQNNPITSDSYRWRASMSPPEAIRTQQHHQRARLPVRKQTAADLTDHSPIPFGKKRSASPSYGSRSRDVFLARKAKEVDDDEEDGDASRNDDELEENEIDEKRPLSMSGGNLISEGNDKLRTIPNHDTKRASAPNESSGRYPGSAIKKQHHTAGRDNMANGLSANNNLYKKQASAHTRISFNEISRPPSFNTCQEQQHARDCRRLDLLEQLASLNCNCSNCLKKRKLDPASINGDTTMAYHLAKVANFEGHPVKKYPKTQAMHLVLKSIILVLCTLLLLVLFVGLTLVSFHLPKAFDQILNVSRSFNVTIAGRK